MQADNPESLRYARALIELGEAASALSVLEEQFPQVRDFFEQNPDARKFLNDLAVRNEGKRQGLQEILGRRVHAVLFHFLCILIEQGEMRRLGAIADAFLEEVSRRRRQVAGELVISKPLADDKVAAIQAETSRLLGKEVALHVRVDPRLLGGILVRVGDVVLDGTLDRQLEDMRQRLLA
jgi:F-type H+-transporting ATPase subunit delta